MLTADNVERLLKSKQAQQIYKSALENAHLDQKLGRLNLEKEINDIKVDFDKSGNSYWTNSNAFKSGRSHRQVFNGLLDDAYTGFYESLESEIS